MRSRSVGAADTLYAACRRKRGDPKLIYARFLFECGCVDHGAFMYLVRSTRLDRGPLASRDAARLKPHDESPFLSLKVLFDANHQDSLPFDLHVDCHAFGTGAD